jgi:signal transduction histidine kinase
VLADSARIEQVLGNLLSNAVKYGDPDTEIMVEVRQQDDKTTVTVTNWGRGIPADEVAQIFTRFYRTRQAQAGRTEGLGLGLYITKGIVEAHHGQMSVESIPGQTTSFSFTLPLATTTNDQ